MLKVDVESGRMLFLADGIPLHEPLLGDEEKSFDSKKKNALFGCFLLAVATVSTIAMIFFFTLYPNHGGGLNVSHNTTSFVFPFEVQGPLLGIDDVSSPQFQAMRWMTENDAKVETTSVMERFALVVLFMATNGAQKWTTPLGFLSHNKPVCDWNDGKRGVFCDSDRKAVVKILLSNLNLQGSIPSELSYLTKLEKLDIANNLLFGDLPETMSSMAYLSELNLEGNLPGFASNTNDLFCHDVAKGSSGFEVLTMGQEDHCSACLCCADCPDHLGYAGN